MYINKMQVGGQVNQRLTKGNDFAMKARARLAQTHGKESFYHNGKLYSSQLPNQNDSVFMSVLNKNTPEIFKQDPVIEYPDYSNEPLDTIPLNQVNVQKQNKVRFAFPKAKPKFQEGGQVQQQQIMQQIAQLIQQGGPEQAVKALVQQGASQEQAIQLVKQVMQAMQGTPAARKGAKLNYLKLLWNKCPEGTELKYYKKGGTVCPVCEKACNGKKFAKGNVISEFRKNRKK